MVSDRVLLEVLGQLGNLRVGQSAVGLTNRQELPSSVITHRKCVIAQHVIAFAMAKLGSHDHDIQCRQFFLEFEPKQDRKSTRLNSRHGSISYAVFCLKKKT